MGDGTCLLLQSLRLEGAHPTMHRQTRKPGDDFVAGWIAVGVKQFLILVGNILGHCNTQLWWGIPVVSLYHRVDITTHMQHHIVVGGIMVMAMDIPVAGTFGRTKRSM